jgi:hypothetical protein
MNARRTPWWYYLAAVLVGLVAGTGIAKYGERTGLSLIGAPWFVSVLLIVLGVVVLVMAWQVHVYTTTEPAKRQHSTFDPMRAVYTLMLAKALAIAGAALTGWYGGQILASLSHLDAPYYSQAITECVFAGVVCLVDMIIGIISEWLCQLPPTEGPENPKMKEAKRRRGLTPAPATKRSTR